MKRILIVFGTRPEAIKMAPLVLEFKKYPEKFQIIICVTGQHREMLDQVLILFGITPDYDLDIMEPYQDLYDTTIKVLTGIRRIIQDTSPDLVFVHGDTTTSFSAALAAFYQHTNVAHVEAGLRTHNKYSPWPEEMNRSITGRIATYHFAPTLLAKQNLLAENINEDRITVTGNTGIDALHWVTRKISEEPGRKAMLVAFLENAGYELDRLSGPRRLVLITGHRRENFGEGFQNICHAIRNLSQEHPDVDFVYPVHLNPNVRKPVHHILGNKDTNNNIFLMDPLDYMPFVYLMSKSYLVLTDSGGIQEEAPGLGKPVLCMRDTTERTEALEAGTVQLVGTNRERIEQSVNLLLNDPEIYRSVSNAINPYGDGRAAERIVSCVRNLK